MNIKMVCRVIGMVLIIEAVFMIVPVFISLYDGDDIAKSFTASIAATAALGVILTALSSHHDKSFYIPESYAATGLSWIFTSLCGALPFYVSGYIPSYLDALFETVSGFTTTGASILSSVEALPRSLLYWRSFSHWLGGMGMLVFLLALLPAIAKNTGSAINLMRAESPGPSVGKLTPRLRHTALILYSMYIALTLLCTAFLLAGGMPLFDSVCTAFGTAGTGGFGIKNDSMASYSPYLQTVTAVFMLLFGVNFNLYFLLLIRHFKDVLRDEELKLYFLVILVSTVLITINISSLYNGVSTAAHHSFFQVSSIITTTGFATTDFDLWPSFSKGILLLLMGLGACAGSTGGGIKMVRTLILMKGARRNMRKSLNPRSTRTIQLNGTVLDEQILRNTNSYFVVYCGIAVISFLIISLDGLSMETNFSAVMACFNNIGPGFGDVGATKNFAVYGIASKVVLILDMLLGRLEIFPILTLFMRRR